MVYISLLRGINVSGQKKIKMADLKKMYESLGFKKVATYIQSGNVVFESKESSPQQIADTIKAQIAKDFGYEVKVMVFDVDAFTKKVQQHPFSEEEAPFVYFTFLSAVPENIPQDKIKAAKREGEQIEMIDDMVYFYCKEGYGRSKLSNNFFEQKLKVDATTRNYKTCMKLIEMGGGD